MKSEKFATAHVVYIKLRHNLLLCAAFFILHSSLFTLSSCTAETEYSSQPCFFAYQNATFLDATLASAMDANSRGVFCQISESVSGGATFLDFKNNMGMSSQKKESALEQGTTYIIGINNGIIVGYQALALSDSPNGGFAAYDLQCPNCVRKHTSYTNPKYRLTMESSGIATCGTCGKKYDMNNRGVIQNGESGDVNLIQYLASTTGPFGYILVRNK